MDIPNVPNTMAVNMEWRGEERNGQRRVDPGLYSLQVAFLVASVTNIELDGLLF